MLRRFLAQTPIVKLALGYSLVAVALSWIYLLYTVRPSSFIVPLHYSYRYGVDVFGAWYLLYYVPLIGTALLAVTAWILVSLRRDQSYLTYFLAVSLVLSQTLLLLESIFFGGLAAG
jgi:hypothetical protein